MSSRLLRLAAMGIGAAAIPVGVAIGGAGTASAGPDVCVAGPLGYAAVCVDAPRWVDPWYDDGPRHDNGRHRGHDH
jgi:hypothetical protein